MTTFYTILPVISERIGSGRVLNFVHGLVSQSDARQIIAGAHQDDAAKIDELAAVSKVARLVQNLQTKKKTQSINNTEKCISELFFCPRHIRVTTT